MDIIYPYPKIRDFLVNHYDANGLDSLFFDICGESIEDLGTNLSVPEIAQKMVVYFKHLDKLPVLLEAMKQSREMPYANTFPEFQNPLGPLGHLLTPGEEVIQQNDPDLIKLPRVQKLGGFVIDEPPEGWEVQELTLRELLKMRFGYDVAEKGSDIQFYDSDRMEQRDILWVSSRSRLRIDFDPGITLMNGRPTMDIVPEEIPIAFLVILPIERNSSPPAFIQQSFEHVFILQIAQSLATSNLKSSTESTTRNTGRLRLTAEFGQRVENAIVNGIPNQSLTTNQTMIGIQGYARDYFLSLSYVTQATSNKAEIENQRVLLQGLVDSFKLIKPMNIEAEELRLQNVANERFKKYVKLAASGMIYNQVALLRERWRGLDWDKSESKKRVIADIKKIQKAIKVFASEDDDLHDFSESLDEIPRLSLSEVKEALLSDDEEEDQPISPDNK